MPNVYVINDALGQLGERTLWHRLCDWLGAEFIGAPYDRLWAVATERLAKEPDALVIRNGSYWPRLETPNPTVALLQDLMPPGHPGRQNQIEACQAAALTVVNSEWTADQYPELKGLTRTIPLPVDFNIFRPRADAAALRKKWAIREGSICWVGATSAIKGVDILHRVIGASKWPYVTVYKDREPEHLPATAWHGRVRQLACLSQADLAEVMAACSVGFCTSRAETQHLAGIEMAGCGLPVVATFPVGIYADCPSWAALPTDPNRVADVLADVLRRGGHAETIAAAARSGPWTEAACQAAWQGVVAEVLCQPTT